MIKTETELEGKELPHRCGITTLLILLVFNMRNIGHWGPYDCKKNVTPRGGGGGVLRISSDGDDRRIFWGLKFSIPGFFLGKKIWQVFFLGGLI